ncbi:hypothetical protein FocnCong_v011040 [Fusarium oxysporum f. sp. conglutinans]|nr:hypothetical protein FocnCong_v011040 [Fusarium oxysporum f. sp. conglutinans]
MFSDYQLFSSGFLPLLAFGEGMLKDLAATDQSRQRAFVSQLSRSRILDAWDANKRHMRAVSSLKRQSDFGIRKEVTLRLDVILAMWVGGRLEPNQSPHTGPMCWEVPLAPPPPPSSSLSSSPSSPSPPIVGEEQHWPFWVIPTQMLTAFVSAQAARFILPLDHIFSEVKCGSPRSGRRKERRGLGLGDSIRTSGTLWIPDGHINWQTGHISLELLVNIYMSRSPLQAKLAHQANVQAFATNQVTIELLFQRLVRNARAEYDRGRNQDAEILADRAVALAVEEIARAYHQHSWPSCTRTGIGSEQAQEESAAETGRIPTAQAVHGIYAEAWDKYRQATADDDSNGDINTSSSSLRSALPEELPCWMTTRRRLPPKNSWSAFLFDQIFCPPQATDLECTILSSALPRIQEVLAGYMCAVGPLRRSLQPPDRTIFEDTVSQPNYSAAHPRHYHRLLDAIKILTGPLFQHHKTFVMDKNVGSTIKAISTTSLVIFAARHREVGPSTESQSLLERFLHQREPPEWDVEPVDEQEAEDTEGKTAEEDNSSSGEDNDDDDLEDIALNDLGPYIDC